MDISGKYFYCDGLKRDYTQRIKGIGYFYSYSILGIK